MVTMMKSAAQRLFAYPGGRQAASSETELDRLIENLVTPSSQKFGKIESVRPPAPVWPDSRSLASFQVRNGINL